MRGQIATRIQNLRCSEVPGALTLFSTAFRISRSPALKLSEKSGSALSFLNRMDSSVVGLNAKSEEDPRNNAGQTDYATLVTRV